MMDVITGVDVIKKVDVVDGRVGGKSYIVDYDEDLWFAGSDEGREYCLERWCEKAVVAGCEVMALRLTPNMLFPRGDHTAPYIVEQRRIRTHERAAWCEMHVSGPVDNVHAFLDALRTLIDEHAGITAVISATRRK